MTQNEIIIGQHAVVAVLENPKRIILSLKCTNEFYLKFKRKINERKIKKFEIVSRKNIDLELKNNFHQGVMITCKSLQHQDISKIDDSEKNLVILDSLTDTQNVGAIIRSCYLFGIKTVIFNKNNSFEITPFLIKSASGAYEKIKFIEVVNINKTIKILKKMGFWVVGLDINSKKNLSSIPKDIRKVLIFGSENKGIRPLIIQNCDFLVKVNLPIKDKSIDSLNVSSTVSIALYECLKK